MAIITLALLSSDHLTEFVVPTWVVLAAALAIGLGTWAGGWRIIRTMSSRIIKMDPVDGFAAETVGAAVIQAATSWGLPVSTTHVVSGSVMGAGATRRLSAVRWGVARSIIWAWILTIPASVPSRPLRLSSSTRGHSRASSRAWYCAQQFLLCLCGGCGASSQWAASCRGARSRR